MTDAEMKAIDDKAAQMANWGKSVACVAHFNRAGDQISQYDPLDGPCWGIIENVRLFVTKYNPLAAMCNYRDTHSTERLPVSKALPAISGLLCERPMGHRLGLGQSFEVGQ